MVLLLPILIPAVAGVLAFFIRRKSACKALLTLPAAAHFLLTGLFWLQPPRPCLNGWLFLDSAGLLFLSITSGLFLVCSVYALGYLSRQAASAAGTGAHPPAQSPESVFAGCMLLFLASMSMIAESAHFGLLWVAVEASTLASAPLIYFHRNSRSLEATWKYLMVCSVGVALALLANFMLAVSAGPGTQMVLESLTMRGGHLSLPWLKASFLFFLVGYGTKMGLAPLHNWLPDAHSESPSVVSALLSGALLNCAFLGILRAYQVCEAAGIGAFARELLVVFGMLSIGLAAIFIIGQADYKRMLAYSSVENMGILALGVGIGGAATFGALLHSVGHSLTKALLFLAAGNILSVYQSKSTREVTGIIRRLPVSGMLWLLGFLAITGSPPFSPFLSIFTIFNATIGAGRHVLACAYLLFLGAAFIGMAGIVLRMALGTPSERHSTAGPPESWLATGPPLLLLAAVLLFGVHLPAPLQSVLAEAARTLGGTMP